MLGFFDLCTVPMARIVEYGGWYNGGGCARGVDELIP
jgi:hypothetical protein